MVKSQTQTAAKSSQVKSKSMLYIIGVHLGISILACLIVTVGYFMFQQRERMETLDVSTPPHDAPDAIIAHGETAAGRSVGIITMMRDQKDVAHWLNYHLYKGVSRFYIRLETLDREKDENIRILLSYPQVTLQIGDPSETPAAADIDEAGQRQMLRQRVWAAEAIKYAFKDGIDWLVHIDSDELLECHGSIGDAIVKDAMPQTQTMIMSNVEAVYSEDRITTAQKCFQFETVRDCNQGHCAAYANGKAVGRVSPFLREFGVHRFRYAGPGQDKEVNMTSLRVLHFESCNFMQYVGKFLRLSASEKRDFPFPYYNESINVARGPACSQAKSKEDVSQTCKDAFAAVYRKYRIV